MPALLRDLPHRRTEADGDVVMDGDGGDLGDRQRRAQLLGADVGQADVPDQAVLAHPGERLDDLFERHVSHGRGVQVVEIDLLQAKAAHAHVGRLTQILPVADSAHVAVLGAAADKAALGRDHELVGIGVQRLADQFFVGMRPVDVGGVDEGHARRDDFAQQRDARRGRGSRPRPSGRSAASRRSRRARPSGRRRSSPWVVFHCVWLSSDVLVRRLTVGWVSGPCNHRRSEARCR